MEVFGQVLVLGAITGLVYALSGAGLVVIYRSSGVINFAHGDIAAVGLYAAYALSAANVPYWLLALCTVGVSALLGLVIGGLLSLPFTKRWSVLEIGLATIALSFIIEGAITQFIGGEAKSFPSFSTQVVSNIAGVQITATDVLTLGVGLLAFFCLGAWFRWSRAGIAMRAVSENGEAASWLGVRTRPLRLISWTIAGSLAGLAGLFVAPLYTLSPTSLGTVVLFGFAAVVTGGFESILGALAAGLAIGIATNLTATYLSVSLITPVMFLLMLLTLVLRPNGVFGGRVLERV